MRKILVSSEGVILQSINLSLSLGTREHVTTDKNRVPIFTGWGIKLLSGAKYTSPPLINFSIFTNPRILLGPPRLLILRKSTFNFFTNSSFHFLSLLAKFTPNFHGKPACLCIYFSSLLYDNLFLFFPSLYNHLKPFLKFRPPVYFDPRLLHFRLFSDPPVYKDPPFIWHLRVLISHDVVLLLHKMV